MKKMKKFLDSIFSGTPAKVQNGFTRKRKTVKRIRKKEMYFIFVLMLFTALLSAIEPGTIDPYNIPNNLMSRSLDPLVSEIGLISWSIDGIGTNNSIGIVQVEKPAGATVRAAYLFSATLWWGPALITGDVKLDGVDIVWDGSIPFANAPAGAFNYYADVTNLVSNKIDTSAPGRIDFEIFENNPPDIDGEILAVIFDDPNQTEEVTIAFMFGAQNVNGDQFNIGLAEPIELDTDVYMSLGISYGYQPGSQVSHIDVNGTRLTSSAGGQDDSDVYPGANGSLITVGGLDDSYDNPPDPNAGATDLRYDDELYTLTPLLNVGDTQITVDTINPSNDDNIFFAAFNISGAAVIGEGCVLSPSFASYQCGATHTVTATLQDDIGYPVAGRLIDFEIIAGPNVGTTDTDETDADGKAYFIYTGLLEGIDTIAASFMNNAGFPQTAVNEVMAEFLCPTPVILSSFTAIYEDNTPTLQWTTQSESNNLGWNVYRSMSENIGQANQMNNILIPGYGTTSEPTNYIFTDENEVENNTSYWYWLESTSYSGETDLYGPVTLTIQIEDNQTPDLPTESMLQGNYPNPFNPHTMINFSIQDGESGALTIYNTRGQLLETHHFEAGDHQLNWNATQYGSGIYFYKLETQNYTNTKKMIMLK